MFFEVGDRVKLVDTRGLPDICYLKLNTKATVIRFDIDSDFMTIEFDFCGICEKSKVERLYVHRFEKIKDEFKICKKSKQ